MSYPLPENVHPPNTVCVQIDLPDDLTYITNFWGNFQKLTRWFAHDRDDSHTGREVANVWLDTFYAAREKFEQRQCGDDIPCVDYPATSQYGFSWGLQDPVNQPDYVPSGWTEPPFYVVDTPLVPGAKHGDILTTFDRFPWDANIIDFAQFWYALVTDGLPRFRFDWHGAAEIELHLIGVPQGGLALVTQDGDISTATFVNLSTLSPLDFDAYLSIIETILGGDFSEAGIVAETIVEIQETGTGAHHVDVTFLPVVDVDELVGWGGGIRKVTVCSAAVEVDNAFVPEFKIENCSLIWRPSAISPWEDLGNICGEDGKYGVCDCSSSSDGDHGYCVSEDCMGSCGGTCIKFINGILHHYYCGAWVPVEGQDGGTVTTAPITDDEIDEVLPPESNPISTCGKASLIATNLRQIWDYAWDNKSANFYGMAQTVDEHFPQWSLHRGSLLQMATYFNLMGASYEDEMGADFWGYLAYQLSTGLNSTTRGLGETQKDYIVTTGENLASDTNGRQAWRFLLNAVPTGVLSDWATGGSLDQTAECLNPATDEYGYGQPSAGGYYLVKVPLTFSVTYPGSYAAQVKECGVFTPIRPSYGIMVQATADSTVHRVASDTSDCGDEAGIAPNNFSAWNTGGDFYFCSQAVHDDLGNPGTFTDVPPDEVSATDENWGEVDGTPHDAFLQTGLNYSFSVSGGPTSASGTINVTGVYLIYNTADE